MALASSGANSIKILGPSALCENREAQELWVSWFSDRDSFYLVSRIRDIGEELVCNYGGVRGDQSHPLSGKTAIHHDRRKMSSCVRLSLGTRVRECHVQRQYLLVLVVPSS